jgi:hypothetical protein
LYLDQEKFNALFDSIIVDLRIKLEGIECAPKILDYVCRANEFGIMESYRNFFKEINLKINEREWKAVKERNRFVHGHVQFDDVDWELVTRQVDTLRTLFNKTLLRIFEYKWDYIDRSVEGWPDAQLV